MFFKFVVIILEKKNLSARKNTASPSKPRQQLCCPKFLHHRPKFASLKAKCLTKKHRRKLFLYFAKSTERCSFFFFFGFWSFYFLFCQKKGVFIRIDKKHFLGPSLRSANFNKWVSRFVTDQKCIEYLFLTKNKASRVKILCVAPKMLHFRICKCVKIAVVHRLHFQEG